MIETPFAGLSLAQPLLRALTDAGYTTPTPIQIKAIPLVLAGGDLLAAAQTGTGKTAGFVLPILQRLVAAGTESSGASRPGRPRCLILTPTRELAAQVEESVRTYGKYVPVRSMVMFGGVGIQPQIAQLRKRVDILVATPGRLLDHAGQRTVDLSGVEILVLDEGDRMLDMGFIHDIRRILALVPKKKQSLLFSATFSDEVRTLAAGLLDNPGCIDVAPRNTAAELVQQTVHLVAKDQKRHALSHLIRQNGWDQVLVFTRTKHGANRLAEKLEKDGIRAAAIHGNKSQAARTRALAQFKKGEIPVLVATDIAARGLDIEELPHVVNFELPNVAEDYVHRIGRTGRAGTPGAAVSLVDSEEIAFLRAIEKLIRRPIERVALSDFVAGKPDASEARGRNESREPRAGHHHRPQRERQPEVRRPRAGSQAAGNGSGHQAHGHGPSHRSHEDNRGNRSESQRRDRDSSVRSIADDLGNRGRRTHGDSAREGAQPPRLAKRSPKLDRVSPDEALSEAARHQAQPQPALFSPPVQRRRRG